MRLCVFVRVGGESEMAFLISDLCPLIQAYLSFLYSYNFQFSFNEMSPTFVRRSNRDVAGYASAK